jgi:hypothetical protein
MTMISAEIDNALARTYGNNTNKHLDLVDVVKILKPTYERKKDIIVERSGITAFNNEGTLNFRIDGDNYAPTNTAVTHISEKTKIPSEYLKATIVRYPALAAQTINTWLIDDDVANKTGTTKEKKHRVNASSKRQLVRLFSPDNGSRGIMRALLSPSYLIVDNIDIVASAIEIAQARSKEIKASGSVNDNNMYVRIKIMDLTSELKFKIPDLGSGHRMINELVGASVLIRNSDVGMSRLEVVPELDILRCTNLLRTTASLSAVHLGAEYKDMDILSKDTIAAINSTVFKRLRDNINACFDKDSLDRLIAAFREKAGESVENIGVTIDNVTSRFGINKERTNDILNAFMEEASMVGQSRFALAQAVTRQAHTVRENDFEGSLELETAGSMILSMPSKEFHKLSIPKDN